jgi:hypothetical protein
MSMNFTNKKALAGATLVLALAGLRAQAFSLLGPGEAWQTSELGYFNAAEVGAPVNLGEEYRQNVPTVYYAIESTFLDYFGLRGAQAVDEAFGVFNSLPPVSQFSENLQEFPLEVSRLNYRAASLQLFDVKSSMMSLIMESLALDDPLKWNWALRLIIEGPNCADDNPVQDYVVIKRNFDPVTWEPSSYVNGALYTFQLTFIECGQGNAVEQTVDPLAFNFSSVASLGPSATFGRFLTGITRDDAGGLRYLYRRDNYNWEQLPAEVQLVGGGGGAWNPGAGTEPPASTLALRAGLEKIRFEKRSFDSLLGTFFVPFTNSFNLTIVTNSTLAQQSFRRAVNAPDILIRAADLTGNTIGGPIRQRTATFSAVGGNGLIGPGTRSQVTEFTFNKVGPTWTGSSPSFMREDQVRFNWNWASFDGTTNAPVIYPSGRSIRELESLVTSGGGGGGGAWQPLNLGTNVAVVTP